MYVPESHEHEMLRDSLRRFLARECPREKVRRWDEEDYYPPELTAKLRELGVFGLTTPFTMRKNGNNSVSRSPRISPSAIC